MVSSLKYYLISLVLLSSQTSMANLKFEALDRETSMTFVNAIYRDNQGFLWIVNGLTGINKDNGYFMVTYSRNPNDSTALTDGVITDIEQDSLQNIWISTSKGLNRYLPDSDNFKRYFYTSDNLNQRTNYIRRLYIDLEGSLWVITRNGLFKYLSETDSFERYDIKKDSRDNNLANISQDSKGQYWVLSIRNGIYLFNPEDKSFKHFFDSNNSSRYTAIKDIFCDDFGNIWIADSKLGVCNFNPQTSSFTYLPIGIEKKGISGNSVRKIIGWKDKLLIGIDQGGINAYDINTGKITYYLPEYNNTGQLSSKGIISLHLDKKGILWAGTSRNGVYYFNPKKDRFKNYINNPLCEVNNNDILDHPSYHITGCFFEDSKGLIWIGTDGGGINIFNKETGKFKALIHDPAQENTVSSNVIRAFSQDANGNIFINTWDSGINCFDSKKEIFLRGNFLKDENGKIKTSQHYWHIFHDSKNRMWATKTNGEIHLFDSNYKLIHNFKKKTPNNTNNCPLIYERKDGKIFTNFYDGIYEVDIKYKNFKKLISINHPSLVSFDNEEFIIVGCKQNGIYLFTPEGKKVANYTTEDGLSHNFVCGICTDQNKNLWISTNNGLNFFDITQRVFTCYYEDDGLPSNQFFLQSYLKTRDGELLFGTTKGFISFFPEKIKQNNTLPPVYINQFYLDQTLVHFEDSDSPLTKPIERTEKIMLSYQQNSFGFGFLAINYTFPKQNKYRYTLEGFENKWFEIDASSRIVSYTNIPPGKYIFKVTACNNDGIWNPKPAKIELEIKPPFWLTYWFIIIVISLFLICIFLAIKIKEKKLELKKKRLRIRVEERKSQLKEQHHQLNCIKDILEDQKEELRTQRDELILHRTKLEQLVEERTRDLEIAKEKAELSDKNKSNFMANMSHEIRTPMNAIVGFSTLLNQPDLNDTEKQEYIKVIATNTESLLSLIENILDYSTLESSLVEISKNIFDLNKLLTDTINSFAPPKNKINLELKLNNQAENLYLTINSDKVRIKQILSNLLDNALKFTEEGYVELKASIQNNQLQLEVIDTGPGISTEDQQLIFNQFMKLEIDQIQAREALVWA